MLKDIIYTYCLVYIDNVLVKSPDFKSHLHSLDLDTRLSESGLKLKPKKCKQFACEVKFLWCIVTADGMQTDPDKTILIEEWPVPTCTKDVRRFCLGIIGYYCKCIPSFSHKVTVFTILFKGQVGEKSSKMSVPVTFTWCPKH